MCIAPSKTSYTIRQSHVGATPFFPALSLYVFITKSSWNFPFRIKKKALRVLHSSICSTVSVTSGQRWDWKGLLYTTNACGKLSKPGNKYLPQQNVRCLYRATSKILLSHHKNLTFITKRTSYRYFLLVHCLSWKEREEEMVVSTSLLASGSTNIANAVVRPQRLTNLPWSSYRLLQQYVLFEYCRKVIKICLKSEIFK